MTPTIEERVARGARLLDERRPGWAGEIDANVLALSSCARCILGQLFGDYVDGIDELDSLTGDCISGVDHGFASTCESRLEELAEYAALTDAWLAEIRSRTEAGR